MKATNTIKDLSRARKIQLLSDLRSGKISKNEYMYQLYDCGMPDVVYIEKGVVSLWTDHSDCIGLTEEQLIKKYPWKGFVFIVCYDSEQIKKKFKSI